MEDGPALLLYVSLYFAPQPNCTFNSDATAGHGFAIFMACRGALRTSCSGAG